MDTNKNDAERIKGIVVKSNQGYFCLDPNDEFVSKSLIVNHEYGMHEIARALSHIRNDSNVLVVGAHIGSICVPLSKYCNKLVAIEANPDTFELLDINIKLNDCKNIESYNFAASDRESTIQFVKNKHNSGGSKRMPIHKDIEYFYDNPEIVEVYGHRLDQLGLATIKYDLIFMDIEGSEYFALMGMQNILLNTKTLIVEFLPHHLERVAGIDVEKFLEPISPHFQKLTLSNGLTAYKNDFLIFLDKMFKDKAGDNGIVFEKI